MLFLSKTLKAVLCFQFSLWDSLMSTLSHTSFSAFTFNSLYEILVVCMLKHVNCRLTFNSLYEIHLARPSSQIWSMGLFQFSLWDSVYIEGKDQYTGKYTFNSLYEILLGLRYDGSEVSLSFNSLYEIRDEDSEGWGDWRLSILFMRFTIEEKEILKEHGFLELSILFMRFLCIPM